VRREVCRIDARRFRKRERVYQLLPLGDAHIGGESDEGVGLKYGDESGTRHVRLYLLALVSAALLALVAAVPVFAVEEPAEEDEGTVQTQVVGGEPVPTGDLPFMVSIQYQRGGEMRHFCGGSLIDGDSVLTAAHCADLIGGVNIPETVSFKKVRLVIGRTELNSQQQGEVRSISRLSDVEVHPRYNARKTGLRHDAAVIDFDAPVSIRPMALAARGGNALERPGRRAAVAGWGNRIRQDTDFSQPDRYPNRMRRAFLPIVSDREGEKVYRRSYVSSLMVSAGKRGVDTCQGDSGGPMWVTTDAGRRQIGITSFGDGCGARGFPGVYTEVNSPSIYDFIVTASTV
jgi:secreted trypsin-like serine protease